MKYKQHSVDPDTIIKLAKAVSLLGGQSAMARQIGVSQPLVSAWLSGERPVQSKYLNKISWATNNQITFDLAA